LDPDSLATTVKLGVGRAGALHDVECRDRTAKTPQLQVSEILDELRVTVLQRRHSGAKLQSIDFEIMQWRCWLAPWRGRVPRWCGSE